VKLAAASEPCGISDAAHTKLKQLLAARALGEYELKGFEMKRTLFAVWHSAKVHQAEDSNCRRRAVTALVDYRAVSKATVHKTNSFLF
jgi:hypothetical protein